MSNYYHYFIYLALEDVYTVTVKAQKIKYSF